MFCIRPNSRGLPCYMCVPLFARAQAVADGQHPRAKSTEKKGKTKKTKDKKGKKDLDKKVKKEKAAKVSKPKKVFSKQKKPAAEPTETPDAAPETKRSKRKIRA